MCTYVADPGLTQTAAPLSTQALIPLVLAIAVVGVTFGEYGGR